MRRQLAAVAIGAASCTVALVLDDRRCLLQGSVEYALRNLHVFEWQVVLIGPQLLGFGAELLAVQLANDNLEPVPSFFGLSQSRLRLGQQRLQSLVFFLKNRRLHARSRAHRRWRRHHDADSESLCRGQPASRGGFTRSGRTNRQSRPSNKAANIAGEIRITPSRTCGHTNLQPSSRLCTSISPVPSQTKILILSAQLVSLCVLCQIPGSRIILSY